jgi:Pyruvate/2-oxoacid:ferredoxin oxidoreductase delta subunit
MGHLAGKQTYKKLRERMDQMPVGAPGRTTIYEILKIIFTPEEAELASKMPLAPQSLDKIARNLKMSPDELKPKLEAMADKGMLVDVELAGAMRYMLAPTMVGVFEFTMMRVREDIDQKKLAELIYRFVIEEPDFVNSLKPDTQTSLFRTLIHEVTLPEDYAEVLDWEKASHVVGEAGKWGVSLCHCRHVEHHRGHDCQKFKMESCLSIGMGADFLIRHNLAREIGKSEALDLILQTRDAGMVHICDNVRRRPTFVCQCCGCCCEILNAFKKFKAFGSTFSSNFMAAPDETKCTGCRKCEKACPVDAIEKVDKPRTMNGKKYRWVVKVDEEMCLGCGVCAMKCEFDSMKMTPRPQRRIAPETTVARVMTMALEQGKLHNYTAEMGEGAMAHFMGAVAGAVLRLPPAKQLLARDALKSRFINFILDRARRAKVPGSDL